MPVSGPDTDKRAGSLLKGARADETGNVGETGDLAPGQAKAIALALKPGHYALICKPAGPLRGRTAYRLHRALRRGAVTRWARRRRSRAYAALADPAESRSRLRRSTDAAARGGA
jgi:hypothetical protein